MSGGRFMIDTDILVFMLRGLKSTTHGSETRQRADRIRQRIEQHLRDGATIYISMVTVCELEFGAQKATDPVRERRALYKILAPFDLVEGDAINLPRHYGEVRRDLEHAGQPIGAMDLMIAAHARALDATLVSNNVQEFIRVTGLKVVNWADFATE